MRLDGKRVLLTGASGGIGREVAMALAKEGARLALVALPEPALEETAAAARAAGAEAVAVGADFSDAAGVAAAADRAVAALGGLDVLVNCAGRNAFVPFAAENPASIEATLRVNLLAPMLLTRRVLARLVAQGGGRIVNVGSTFGSIGFPFFATYSGTKFGIRGFSEALRRELRGTGVGVTYVAPRATRTPMNDSFSAAAEAMRMKMDEPAKVAALIVRAIAKERRHRFIGFPEKLFVRINSLLPGFVDRALAKQTRIMRPFAEQASARR